MERRLQLIRPPARFLGRCAVRIRNCFARALGGLSPALFNLLANTFSGSAERLLIWLARPWLDVQPADGCPVPAMWCSWKFSSTRSGAGGIRANKNVLVFMPGGAFVVRSVSAIPFAVTLLPRLAKLMDPPRLLVLNYNLPAEREATVAAVEAAVEWVSRQSGVDTPSSVIVSGDSAGGHLAVELACRAAGSRTSPIVGSVSLCPWLDLTLSSRAWRENRFCDFLSKRWVSSGARTWVRGAVSAGLPLDQALLASSPALLKEEDLASLQPEGMMMVAGTWDRLRDDAISFAAKAPKGSVLVHLLDDGIIGTHDGLLFSASPKADAAWDAVASYCARRFGAAK